MKTRIISAIVGLFILAPFFYYSSTYAFCIIISLVSIIGVYEMLKCVKIQKLYSISIPLYILAIITPIFAHYYKESSDMFPLITVTGIFIFLMYLFANIVFRHDPPLTDILSGFMSVLYILAGFVSLVLLADSDGGEWILILVFVAAWVTDIFAYFCGVFFGHHKLIPHVSPKKTIEGSIGGIVFCTLGCTVFGILISRFTPYTTNYALMIACGIILSVVSQIGDLVMSVIKRHYCIKDYGKLIPGHGGILDRFDSIISVSLVLYIILQTSKIFFDIQLF